MWHGLAAIIVITGQKRWTLTRDLDGDLIIQAITNALPCLNSIRTNNIILSFCSSISRPTTLVSQKHQNIAIANAKRYRHEWSTHHEFGPIPTPPLPLFPVFCRWALLPLNKLCQIKASLSNSSMSFSVHWRVGSAWRNIMISWKSILRSWSDHLTRNAAHTYKWKDENPSSSA